MLSVSEINSRKKLKQFINLPWKIYRNNPYWIPPIKHDLKTKINASLNPFFEYGSVKYFGVFNQADELLGRVAAIINPKHNDIYNDKSGFFGLFECIDDKEVASKLLERVKSYLSEKRFNNVIGPVNFTTNDEAGLLIEGYNYPPMIMSNYCPQYYHELLNTNGFQKEMDLLSFIGYSDNIFPERYTRIVNKVSNNSVISTHVFNRHKFNEQVKIMTSIYNEAFKENWGFVPLSIGESTFLTKQFLPIADEKLIWFVSVNGNPAGFVLGLPNINEILSPLNGKLFRPSIIPFLIKKKNIRSYRVIVLCVIPKYRGLGIESILINQIRKRVCEKPYSFGEHSIVLENNSKMIRVLEAIGLKLFKRFRIYKAII